MVNKTNTSSWDSILWYPNTFRTANNDANRSLQSVIHPMHAFQTEPEKMPKSFSKEPKATWGTSTATKTSTTVGSRRQRKNIDLTPQAYLRNTPRGGKRMAIRISQKVAPELPFPIVRRYISQWQCKQHWDCRELSNKSSTESLKKPPRPQKHKHQSQNYETSSKSLPDKQTHAIVADG